MLLLLLLLLLPDVVESVKLAEEALLTSEAVELVEELPLEAEVELMEESLLEAEVELVEELLLEAVVVELVEEILLIEETPELVDVILLGSPADEELVDVTLLAAVSIELVDVKSPVPLMAFGSTLLVLVSTVTWPVIFEALKLVEIVSFAPGPVGRYSMTVTAEPEDGSTVENEMVEPE